MKVVEYFEPSLESTSIQIPYFDTYIKAGFPSPAESYTATMLDIATYLVKRQATTYYIRVEGDSMYPLIDSGSLLIVDRSYYPESGDIVVALIDRELTVKRIKYAEDQVLLVPENKRLYPTVPVSAYSDFEIQGVVTFTIKPLKKQ